MYLNCLFCVLMFIILPTCGLEFGYDLGMPNHTLGIVWREEWVCLLHRTKINHGPVQESWPWLGRREVHYWSRSGTHLARNKNYISLNLCFILSKDMQSITQEFVFSSMDTVLLQTVTTVP